MRALQFTAGSPFARGVRVILDELGLDWERREETTSATVAERAAATPTLQVPILWDGDRILWESGVTAEYLLREYRRRPAVQPPLAAALARPEREWDDRLVFATIQTLGTAVTTVSQMTWTGVRHCENEYLARCANRLPHLLQWLDARISREGGFFDGELSAQDIFLVCHLEFIVNRPLGLDPALARFPSIEALIRRLRDRASFQNNPILWWEPEVTSKAMDSRTPGSN